MMGRFKSDQEPAGDADREMLIIGVDTGGTFTDLICWDQGRFLTHKLLSLIHI